MTAPTSPSPDALLPCAHCGRHAMQPYTFAPTTYRHIFNGCVLEGLKVSDPIAWNTRTHASAPTGQAGKETTMNPMKWAELLIVQLPDTHDGRNSWLSNHGLSEEADRQRDNFNRRMADAQNPRRATRPKSP